MLGKSEAGRWRGEGANMCAVWRPCLVVGCVMEGVCAVVSAVRYVARGLVGEG
jgi:hypothetical protein